MSFDMWSIMLPFSVFSHVILEGAFANSHSISLLTTYLIFLGLSFVIHGGGGVKIIHPRRVVVEVKSDLPKILYILNGLFLSIFEWIFFLAF